MRLPRRARLGLRARITLAYGLGALLLSTMLASITWGLTRENLLNQRDDAAVERVVRNAVFISDKIGPEDDPQQTLAGVSTPEGSTPLLRLRGEWIAINPVVFQADDVAPALLDATEAGTSARMRYNSRNGPILVVGVPIPAEDALYFESVSLQELQDTMNGLGIILTGAALVTTLAGFALGYYASGRALRPLTEVGEAAQAIAGGRLDTRLEAEEDPDLRPFTESFNAMAQALQERVERDGRFASEVSHELRSPLMTLMASIEVLQNSREELPERSQTAVDLLSHDIERFQQLVEDLLEISRFDAGAVRLELSEVFAAEMVERTVGALVGTTVPVVVDPAAAEAVVRVDKRRMGQVIANLLDNAQKYADGASLVSVESADGAVRIAIQDDGPGVPEEEREVIFDRFSRGGSGGKRADDFGTGLGLSLVREHVHLHSGRVWTEDRPDGAPGGRFVIELPTVDAHGPDNAPEFTQEELALDEVPVDEPVLEQDEEIVG